MTLTRPRHTITAQQKLKDGLPERRYLPELHGVRGLALAGVVLFHLFGNGRVSGGIDIFLAVSGFLFTGMLLREAAATGGRVDPLKYYGRLIRRILVPATIVIAATLAAGLLISPVTQHRQLWSEARASLLYFENFELISSQLAYGAAGPDTSPFQHFWSLSVQGQFYIIWPAIAILSVLVAKRLRTSAARIMGLLVTVILVASFVYAIYVGSFNQDENYLMTITRAWELAFGGLLALAGGTIRLPQPLRGIGGWVGLALVVSCGLVLDGGQLFPGPWALWPLLGLTLTLISAGPQGGDHDPTWSATRFLSNRPLAWIGDHAYGLYLWHWPLLIYYLEIRDRDAVGWRGALVILAITLALAMLMYRYIEQPLQRAGKHGPVKQHFINRITVWAGASTLIITGLVMAPMTQASAQLDTTYGDLDPATYPGAAQYFMTDPVPDAEPFPALENVEEYKPAHLHRDCVQKMGDAPGTDEVTVCEDENAPEHPTATIVLAGGSHAGHYEAAFKTLARKYDWEVLIVLKSSCVFGWEQRPDETMCGQWNENFVTWLGDNDVDLVVTPGTRQDPSQDTEYVVDAAPRWWDKITATGTDLLLVRGTPRNTGSVPACLAEGKSAQECGPSKHKFAETNPLENMELPDKAHPVDMTKYVCPKIEDPQVENCDAVVGNVVGWFDGHHFTAPFAQSLAPGFEAELKKTVPHILR